MNYYRPLELKDTEGKATGLWHYTVTNDGRSHAVGYCAADCSGHATPDEAREHYKEYLVNECTRYDGKLSDMQKHCEVCGEWTQRIAEIPIEMSVYPLCDLHCNREEVSKLLKVGDAVSSY